MSKKRVVIQEDNGDERTIGVFDKAKRLFITSRKESKHLLRKYNAWAVDKKLLTEVLVPKDADVLVNDVENRIGYRVSARQLLNQGEEIQFHQHREQVYLRRDKFEKEEY